VIPIIKPPAYISQYGVPSPTKAGTKYSPSVESTLLASSSTSSELFIIFNPSLNHCTTAPEIKTEPSRA